MSKILAKVFPFFDYLYIYQLFEYNSSDFLKWFLKNPLKRHLQKKHSLEWTNKSLALSVLSLSLMILALRFSLWFVFIIVFLSPLFLIASQIILNPLEYFQKEKIISAAKKKIQSLPNIKVVAIVGSYAKTSTKDMLYTLLWKDYQVVKTPKSYNTSLSIARTILSDLKQNTEIFLVEMDAYHPGDIRELCQIANPSMGIITAIAPQHLQRFGSMEKLAKAQFELAEELPKDSLLFINNNDEWSIRLSPNYRNKKIYIDNEQSDFYAKNILQSKEGITFILHTKEGGEIKIELPILGTHNVYNFLAAAAIANKLGLSLEKISKRAKKILPTPHRLEIRKQGTITIIDNTYNTNPAASKASLKLLKDIAGSQKIVITPGLVELGSEHVKENEIFGSELAKVANVVIIVGQNAKVPLLKGLNNSHFPKSNIHLTDTTKTALALMGNVAKPGAVVLMENDLPDQYF